MKKAYIYNPENNYLFKEEVDCQTDPVASKKSGETVYLLPGNSTFEVPPEKEDGYVIIFENGHWVKKHDYKGRTYYVTADGYYGSPKEMMDYGDLPEGCSFERPPMTTEEQAQADLDSAKATRATKVDALTVTVDGMVFDADETSQNRMSRVVAGAQALGVDLNTTTQIWVLADNTVATPTVAQLAHALKLAGEAQTALWTKPYEESYTQTNAQKLS